MKHKECDSGKIKGARNCGSGKIKGARNCGNARMEKLAYAVFHVFSRIEECFKARFS